MRLEFYFYYTATRFTKHQEAADIDLAHNRGLLLHSE